MSALPPGPRSPRLLQSRRWSRAPLPFLEQCRARYGATFTLRLRHLGTWVLLADPEDVKRVFSADTDDLGVGVPNLALRPVLGAHSVMLSEEPEHMARRKMMLPRFHGERMREDAELMTELARREVRAWPVDEPFRLWPRMQALTQEVVMRAVFGDDDGRLDRLRGLLTNLTETVNDEGRLRKLALFGPRWLERSRGWREAMAPVEQEVLAEVQRRRARKSCATNCSPCSPTAPPRARSPGSSSGCCATPRSCCGCRRKCAPARGRPIWTR